MKKTLLTALLLASAIIAGAQQANDPVIMTVNGVDVPRSEFEYSYNKNNTEGVIDKKTVKEFVELFVNYKLKVAAALDEKMDTLFSFKKEFQQYRDQQIRPYLISEKDMEAEAHHIYNSTKERIGEKGLIKPAHIFLRLGQNATKEEQENAKVRIDSIYNALKKGADFAALATTLSQDQGTAKNGGELPWISVNQTLKEFEDAAFALKDGEMSAPVLSPAGYHIILMKGHKQLEPFDSLKNNIYAFMEQRNVREHVINRTLDNMVKASDKKLTRENILDNLCDSLCAQDRDLKYLIQEYHDGLLLYEVSNRMVWERAAKDEAGLAAYFKKNKKKYNWDTPHFKGMAYHVKTEEDKEAVKNCVKDLPFDQWAEKLRTTFNGDSVIRIRVEKGLFKMGDNALIDKEVFKKDTTVTPLKDYPIDAVYGKVLKKKPEDYTDVKGQVTADYQDLLEKQWVAQLRKKYLVKVNNEVVETVNKH